MRKPTIALAIVLAAVYLARGTAEPQLGTVPSTVEPTTTTIVITTFPTIVPTLPPFTTAPVPTRPPTTPLTTAPPATTAPPTTLPEPEPPPPTTVFRPPATSPRVTSPPTTELLPIPDTPAAVAAPPAGAPPATTLPPGTGMVSDKVASEPGGVVTLTGAGCTPNAPVNVRVGDRTIGAIPGTPDGKFIAILTLPQVIEVGRYDVVITCGVVHALPIDIVVASHLDSGNSVLALFIFFVLLCIALFRRRRLVFPKKAAADDDFVQP